MKKLLSLATLLIILSGSVSETFAAKTIVKKFKVQAQAKDFFGNTLPSSCSTTPRIRRSWSSMSPITTTIITDTGKKGNEAILIFAGDFTPDKGKKMCNATLEMTVMNCDKRPVTKTITMKPNKQGTYEATIKMPSAVGCTPTLTAAKIHAVSNKGEETVFVAIID